MTTIFRCGTTACAHLHRLSARIGVLLSFFRSVPPIDVLSPPDPPEWDRELRRLPGLVEIHSCKADNLVFFSQRQARRTR